MPNMPIYYENVLVGFQVHEKSLHCYFKVID